MENTFDEFYLLISRLQDKTFISIEDESIQPGDPEHFLNENRNKNPDETIIDFYTQFNEIVLNWHDYNWNIEMLDTQDNISGSIYISGDAFRLLQNTQQESVLVEPTILETLHKHKLYDDFYSVDILQDEYLVGLLRKDGSIQDRLYMIRAFDDAVHDLKIGCMEYLHCGLSAAFFKSWQEIFIDKNLMNERVKKIGYYLPKLLPENANGIFMQKFKECFGEVDYTKRSGNKTGHF